MKLDILEEVRKIFADESNRLDGAALLRLFLQLKDRQAALKDRQAAHKNLVAVLKARGRHLHEATVAATAAQEWDEVLYE